MTPATTARNGIEARLSPSRPTPSPSGPTRLPKSSRWGRVFRTTFVRMTAYVSAKTGMGSQAPRRPLRREELAIGAAVLLLVGLALGTGRSRDEAHVSTALTAAEKAQVASVLADAHETRTAAIAYFEAMHETERLAPGAPSPAQVHAEEIEALVTESLRSRLTEALGPTRAALATREHHPLAAFLATR